MKVYKDHASTGKLIQKMKTRHDINTYSIMYHSVAVPFPQVRMSNFNTDINEYFNTRKMKKKQNNKTLFFSRKLNIFKYKFIFLFIFI